MPKTPKPRRLRNEYTMVRFEASEKAKLRELVAARNAESPFRWDMGSVIRDLVRQAKK